MKSGELAKLIASGAPRVIHTDEELEEYTQVLFELTAKPKPSEAEGRLIELLDLLIEKYEGEHFAIPAAAPLDVLRYLMERNALRQQDLVPQLGSLPLISLILNGKRNLTVQHIRALAERFRVPAGVFLSGAAEVKTGRTLAGKTRNASNARRVEKGSPAGVVGRKARAVGQAVG